jgi:hypothetical protein
VTTGCREHAAACINRLIQDNKSNEYSSHNTDDSISILRRAISARSRIETDATSKIPAKQREPNALLPLVPSGPVDNHVDKKVIEA